MAEITYLVNNTDFKTHGVYVSASNGLVDALQMKEPFTFDWPEYHGNYVDLSSPKYLPRQITLNCWLRAENRDDFIAKVQAFIALFTGANTKRLTVLAHSTKPLVYEVYLSEGISIDKTWSESEMFGTFTLSLIEPDPVKRVVSFTGSGTISITTSSTKMLTIFWGDGTKTDDIVGANVVTQHTYLAGSYIIIIAGDIDDITTFNEGVGTVLWYKI